MRVVGTIVAVVAAVHVVMYAHHLGHHPEHRARLHHQLMSAARVVWLGAMPGTISPLDERRAVALHLLSY